MSKMCRSFSSGRCGGDWSSGRRSACLTPDWPWRTRRTCRFQRASKRRTKRLPWCATCTRSGTRTGEAMTYSLLAARAVMSAAVLALVALAALHILKHEVHPSRTMISQYALGRHGWVMALCFAAFGVASVCLFIALVASVPSLLGGIGLAFLLAAGVGLAMAASFPMDPVSTPPGQRSFSGKMHGVAFLIGVPCQVLAVLLLSLALGSQTLYAPLPLLEITVVIWLSLTIMIAVMLIVGPGKQPDQNGPERFLGWPNRLFMVAYGVWLMVVAWPTAR